MWTPNKSVILSSICTKIVIAAAICFVIFASDLTGSYIEYTGIDLEIQNSLLPTIYACSVPSLIALFCLDRLLSNIKKDEVFTEKNVKYLRIISWCCFAVSAVMLVSGLYYIFFLSITAAAAFFGLILRVVKNVIEKAMIIKNENDFTI